MTLVLVVDDSPLHRRLVGGLLEKQDHAIAYAADGHEALRSIEVQPPDIVVTDLQMPGMDGLQLLDEIRSKLPRVPVIVMTGHGSEARAVESLQAGAVAYVPKVDLVKQLPGLVNRLRQETETRQRQQRLLEGMVRSEACFVLDNDVALIPALVEFLQEMTVPVGLTDEPGRMRIGMAVTEALFNALYHGNLELGSERMAEVDEIPFGLQTLAAERKAMAPYSDRRLHVDAVATRDELRIRIRDEGPGFDVAAVPDPTAPENLTRITGRGLIMMRMFMDEVVFNATGNEVVLVKRRTAPG